MFRVRTEPGANDVIVNISSPSYGKGHSIDVKTAELQNCLQPRSATSSFYFRLQRPRGVFVDMFRRLLTCILTISIP